ncbi:MAG: glycosyltransferase family 2 protein, partial [Thermoplasmata archaeon]
EQGMGAGAEILQKAAQSGLRVTEAPVSIRYGAGDTSTHQPVYHGLDVLGSTLKHLSVRHPLLFYGLPAIVFIALGVFFGVWALQIYAATTQLITNIALVSLTSMIVGLILGTTAVILFTLVTVLRER